MLAKDRANLTISSPLKTNHLSQSPSNTITFNAEEIQQKLLNLRQPCHVFFKDNQIGISARQIVGMTPQITVGAMLPENLGDRSFLDFHRVKYAYAAGAMAGGISSEELVITLGKAKILASFGSAGLLPQRIESAIQTIQKSLPQGPYAFNLIHSPSEQALEKNVIELYLKYGIRTVEASAYMDLTPHIVRYRVAGLHLNSQGNIETRNKVIAKVSRQEVAQKFMQPASTTFLKPLVEQGLITPLQATLAEKVPLADDITVEADSGGHTDNRSLVCLLPIIINLRNKIQQQYNYEKPVRVGAAGGIGNPEAALAAFMMGASYIVTGSVNHSCLEAGTSEHTKQLLAQAGMADVVMAPCADMFEMGVKVQLLKRGNLFPMRAQKLYEIYKTYDGIEAIPANIRQTLEKQIFGQSLDRVWSETAAYFSQRDPQQIRRAEQNPRRKMALIFRWYLGLSSRWSTSGEPTRKMDYQIWCGPAMGSFNEWVRGSYLELPKNRRVIDVATNIMRGAAYLYRLRNLQLQGLKLPSQYFYYHPVKF
jgi:trans-AT polyketide synthase, acyltransferase and oxidoreductase domains